MYTSQDAVTYLMDTVGGGAMDSEHRVLRQAVFHAYRDLITARDWRWYETHDSINVDRSYVEHLLPWGVQSVDSFKFDDHANYQSFGRYVHPRDFQRLYDDELNELAGTVWTLDKSTYQDRYRLRILNQYGFSPSIATLTYRRRPKDLRLTGLEKNSHVGTVDLSGVDVVGTGTKFTKEMVGSVIRVNGEANHLPEPLTGMYPYTHEAIIYQVDSPTRAYAWAPEEAFPVQGSRYVVTDMLDLAPGMYTALLSGAEVWAARLLGKNVEGAYGLYGRDLRMAFESDAVAVLTGREHLCGCGCDFWYLRPGTDQGVGGPGSGGPNEDGPCPLHEDLFGGDADSDTTNEFDKEVQGGTASTNFTDCGDPT